MVFLAKDCLEKRIAPGTLVFVKEYMRIFPRTIKEPRIDVKRGDMLLVVDHSIYHEHNGRDGWDITFLHGEQTFERFFSISAVVQFFDLDHD